MSTYKADNRPIHRQFIQEWRNSLVEARLSGVRRVKDQNGEEMEYRSDAEMAAAIRYADSLLVQSKPNTIIFNTSKGV